MPIIEVYNSHCCGEIGDVIVSGDIKLEGETIFEQSKYLFDNKKLRNFVLNEPRGGVFKHCNLIVPPKKMFGDNAGMIAWACIQKLKHSKIKNDLYFRPNPRLEIENKL